MLKEGMMGTSLLMKTWSEISAPFKEKSALALIFWHHDLILFPVKKRSLTLHPVSHLGTGLMASLQLPPIIQLFSFSCPISGQNGDHVSTCFIHLAVLLEKYCKNKFMMAISSKERVKNVPSNLILQVTLSQESRGWFVGNSGKAEDCEEGADPVPPQT